MKIGYFVFYQVGLIASMMAVSLMIAMLSRRRNVNGVKSIIVLCTGLFVWTLGYSLKSYTSVMETQILFDNISNIGILIVPSAWIVFSVNYTLEGISLNRWKLLPFLIFPAITALILWHPDLRHLMWTTESLVQNDQVFDMVRTYGPFFWIFAFYSYVLLFVGSIILLWKLHDTKLYLHQALTTIIAVVIPLLVNILYVFDLLPMHKDVTPIAFTLSVFILIFGMYHFNLFRIIPLANKSMIYQMKDSILIFDMAHHLVEANRKAIELFDLVNQDIGKRIDSILSLPDSIKQLLKDQPEKKELTWWKDGSLRYLDAQTTKLFDINNNETGYIIILHDFTEEKRIVLALIESEERFRSILNSMDDTAFTLDTDMRYTGIYGSHTDDLGVDLDAAIGKTIWEVFGESTREPNEPYIKKVLDGESVIYEWDAFHHESRYYYQMYLYPIRDEHGNVYSVFGIGRDITDTVRSEEGRRISEAALRSMHDGVIITDEDWIVRQWNPVSEEMFGITQEEAVGQFIGHLVNALEEYPGQVKDKVAELEKGRINKETVKYHTPKGDVWADIHCTAIEVNDKHIGWIMLLEDISQQKMIEEQMLAQDRLASIGKLTSGIAHEINNPLAIIKGLIELTLDSDISEDTRTDMSTANEEIDRASSIIKNLLTFARNQSSEKTSVDINSLIKKTLEMREYQQKQHNILTTIDLAPDIPDIWGSETQLRQVLINIIINAEYYITDKPDGGKIHIGTACRNGSVKFSISDNGPGIVNEKIKHIFDPFYTSKSVGEGTGLGLSICYGIIEDHKGTIEVESDPGAGTTFIISLPVFSPKYHDAETVRDHPEILSDI